ncbi:MAG: 6-phosphogluconolactonase [Candidatus Peribacteraceae bacterium]|nr:6-phosphogluconolactonase [Candidatus Peribacteraceae bacterium]
MQYDLIETETEDAFLDKATSILEKQIGKALSKAGRCTLCLAGGSTPLPVYQRLATRPIDWGNVWIYLADERYVAPDHPDSNQRAIRETLVNPVALPPDHFIAPDTWKPLEECVNLYEAALKDLLSRGPTDVAILGMGEDGHVGSLFPPLSKDAFETSICALRTHTDTFAVSERITVTVPVLVNAEVPVLLLRGRLKKRAWTQMMEGPMDPAQWPALSLLATGRCSVVAQWIPSPTEE